MYLIYNELSVFLFVAVQLLCFIELQRNVWSVVGQFFEAGGLKGGSDSGKSTKQTERFNVKNWWLSRQKRAFLLRRGQAEIKLASKGRQINPVFPKSNGRPWGCRKRLKLGLTRNNLSLKSTGKGTQSRAWLAEGKTLGMSCAYNTRSTKTRYGEGSD